MENVTLESQQRSVQLIAADRSKPMQHLQELMQ